MDTRLLDRKPLDGKKKKVEVTKSEIQELMDLKGWTRRQLASEMKVTLNTIDRWLMDRRRSRSGEPAGPAIVLLRLWIDEARQEAGVAELQGATA